MNEFQSDLDAITQEIIIFQKRNRCELKVFNSLNGLHVTAEFVANSETGLIPTAEKGVAKPKYREVKRKAKVGEKIKVINEMGSLGKYKNGDILTVEKHIRGDGITPNVLVCEFSNHCVLDKEYVVLEPLN